MHTHQLIAMLTKIPTLSFCRRLFYRSVGNEHVGLVWKNGWLNRDAVPDDGSNMLKEDVLDGGLAPPLPKGQFLGEMGQLNVTYRKNVASAVQKTAERSICRLEQWV